MKKVIYVAPALERVTVELEAPIAYSAGGGGYSPSPHTPGIGGTAGGTLPG